jgi:CubicO group peptidase (beta-lactamase class C family)
VLGYDSLTRALDHYAGSRLPGLQYLVVNTSAPVFAYAGGWADIKNERPMTLDTTMMAYSMTKTFTAVAVLQLVDGAKVRLDDTIDRYVSFPVPSAHRITVRQLLNHTSGLPNPVPLRWVHLSEEDATFNERAALERVLNAHPKLSFPPGTKFAYSNIGYWLLGQLVEQVTGKTYRDYVRADIFQRLGLSEHEMGFTISDTARHANGYLARFSFMNAIKGLVTDRKFWGGYEGRWFRFNDHYLDGPAFGGIVASATAVSRFLQDQLGSASVVLGPTAKTLLEMQQTEAQNRLIPMTLGWQVGTLAQTPYFFKEGGGGGFHSEMRLYPSYGLGSVVMANDTEFRSTKFLNRHDRAFLA